MIPSIGLMVGLYILTRMFELLATQPNSRQYMAVKVFAVITVLVTILAIADLMTRGASVPSFP